MKKIYIKDFCEDLNYRQVILYIDPEVNITRLRNKLKNDNVNHLYAFDWVITNRLFYIENCDLQYCSFDANFGLINLLDEGFSILHLKADEIGFYIVVPDVEKLLERVQ